MTATQARGGCLGADFVVTTVGNELAVEAARAAAGCPPAGRATVMRRFFTLADFLWGAGLTTRVVVSAPARLHEYTQLCRSDLTEEGEGFVRACLPAWRARACRDLGDRRERGVLAGWLAAYRARRPAGRRGSGGA